MRGLARPDHVRLLQGYCPLCFKGAPGKSGCAWVHKTDTRIDEELSRMPNGLPPLDLTTPGEPCEHSQMCRMLCLVCGKSMADGDEPSFPKLIDLVDELKDRIHEHREQVMAEPGLQILADAMAKDLKRERDKALRKYGLAWIDRWEKPAHKGCTQETPCQCGVPACSDTCLVHKRRLPVTHARNRRATAAGNSTKNTPVPTIMESKPVHPPNVTIIPALPGKRANVILTKATWMQKPSEIASTSSSYKASPEAESSYQQGQSKKRKPPAAKPNLRLQAAAAKCQKINSFINDEGKAQVAGQGQNAAGPEGEEVEYDLEWHNANFDPWKHGDFWRGGQMWFRRPDGKVIPSFEGVRKFTKSGYLIPG